MPPMTDPAPSRSSGTAPCGAILVPVYENATTIESVLRGVAVHGRPVFVVDDGGRDGSCEIAAALEEEGVVAGIVRCPRNLGKAGALRLGFARLRELGFEVAIAVDADGQHDVEMVGPMLEIAEANPGSLVVGCRWPLHPDQPRRNLVGRFFSNVAIRAHAGVSVGDAPCGFRSWPLDATIRTRGRSGRYAWEQEMITRLAWRGVRIDRIDIPAIYHPRETRVSHYRFRRDWPEGIAIYAWLLLVALLPIPRGGREGVLRCWRRRFARLLSPGRLRGGRPEAWTDRLFVVVAISVGLVVGAVAPPAAWAAAIAGWVGWRWHAGLGPILLAASPWIRANPETIPLDVALTVAAAWLIGGVLRPRA